MASTLYLRIPPELKERIQAVALKNRRKLNAQVELMIEEWLDEHEPKEEDAPRG